MHDHRLAQRLFPITAAVVVRKGEVAVVWREFTLRDQGLRKPKRSGRRNVTPYCARLRATAAPVFLSDARTWRTSPASNKPPPPRTRPRYPMKTHRQPKFSKSDDHHTYPCERVCPNDSEQHALIEGCGTLAIRRASSQRGAAPPLNHLHCPTSTARRGSWEEATPPAAAEIVARLLFCGRLCLGVRPV